MKSPALLLAATLVLLCGCSSLPEEPGVFAVPRVAKAPAPESAPAPGAEPLPEAPPGDHYRINVNDELDIRFPDRADLNESVRVRPDGRISLRLIQSFPVEGRTPTEVEADIAARYRALAGPPGEGGALPATRYVVGVGDELEVRFPYHANFDQSVKVRPDGRITLNLVRTVVAEGKSPEELESELNSRYRAFLKRPDLVVVVKSYAENRLFAGTTPVRGGLAQLQPVVIVRNFAPPQVFVGGEVDRPGVLAYRGRMTALSAIVEAGGPKATGQLGAVMVLRRNGPTQAVVIRRDLRADLAGAGTSDVLLEPFDVVVIPKTELARAGTLVDQFLNVVPPLRNIGFSFVYELGRRSVVISP